MRKQSTIIRSSLAILVAFGLFALATAGVLAIVAAIWPPRGVVAEFICGLEISTFCWVGIVSLSIAGLAGFLLLLAVAITEIRRGPHEPGVNTDPRSLPWFI